MKNKEDDDIMTLAEVAAYLKFSERTILKLIKEGSIPCFRLANQWRFLRPMINDWLVSKMNVVPQNDFSRLIEQEYDYVPLSRLMEEKLIVMDLQPGSKKEILDQLCQPAQAAGFISLPEKLIEGLLQREKLHSTAIAPGIALPHLRKPSSELILGPRIVIGLCREGLDFGSLDGNPTQVIFLVLTDSEIVHLKIMARLGALLRSRELIGKIIAAKTAKEVLRSIIAQESKINFKGDKL